MAATDKRFETHVDKIAGLHHNVALLYSGGQDLSDEIVSTTIEAIRNEYPESGDGPTVRNAAATYHETYLRTRIAYAESAVLPNYQMVTRKEYDKKRRRLDPVLVRQIDAELANFDFDEHLVPMVIMAGVDATGPHIYLADGGRKPQLRDKAGFAAVGITAEQATDFLIAHHAPLRPYGEALMLTYIAKKLGQNHDLGVGDGTGIGVIGHAKGQVRQFHAQEISVLQMLYHGTIEQGRGGPEMAVRLAGRIQDSPWDAITPPAPVGPAEAPQAPSGTIHDP